MLFQFLCMVFVRPFMTRPALPISAIQPIRGLAEFNAARFLPPSAAVSAVPSGRLRRSSDLNFSRALGPAFSDLLPVLCHPGNTLREGGMLRGSSLEQMNNEYNVTACAGCWRNLILHLALLPIRGQVR